MRFLKLLSKWKMLLDHVLLIKVSLIFNPDPHPYKYNWHIYTCLSICHGWLQVPVDMVVNASFSLAANTTLGKAVKGELNIY